MSLPLRLNGPSKLATDPLRDKADWPLTARIIIPAPALDAPRRVCSQLNTALLPAGRVAELFATCDGLHDLGDAVAEGDGEYCSKFRSDEVRNGASCEAKHDRACSFTVAEVIAPAILAQPPLQIFRKLYNSQNFSGPVLIPHSSCIFRFLRPTSIAVH